MTQTLGCAAENTQKPHKNVKKYEDKLEELKKAKAQNEKEKEENKKEYQTLQDELGMEQKESKKEEINAKIKTNGRKKEEKTYKDGKLISKKEWNEDGSVKE